MIAVSFKETQFVIQSQLVNGFTINDTVVSKILKIFFFFYGKFLMKIHQKNCIENTK